MTMMLLEWVFTSNFLILVVLVLRAALGRRMSAGLRYALWAVVLVRLLVPVQLFTSPIAGTWVLAEGRGEQTVITPPAAPTAPSIVANNPAVPVIDAPPGNLPLPPSVPEAPEAPEVPEAPDLTKAPAYLGWTWLAGSGLMAGVFLLSNLRFSRRLRRRRLPLEGTDCPRPVYAAVGLPSPCLFGVLRPAVYVTPEAAADPAMLRHVLAHEYTHFRHGDHLWSLLRCAALAIHWWNPLVWLAVALSRRDGELACDEGALKRLGDGERLAYGNTLLALVTAKPRPGDLLCFATTMAGDKKSLKERFARIAQAPKRWLWAAVVAVLVTALACGCAFGQKADPAEESDFWPYSASEMTYVRDAGGFGGDFGVTLNRDGTFSYCEGYLSSYIGMGTWTREGDVICLADEGLRGSAGIQRYYFKIEGGCLVFQAENSAEFMYVDVADGERFSQRTAAPEAEVEIAFDHAGTNLASSFLVPDEVLDAARSWVAQRFAQDAPGGTMTPSWGAYNEETGQWEQVEDPDPDHAAHFDRVRINYMNGFWGYPQGETDYIIWCINFEYHTTTPEQAENLLVGGRYLTEDDWFCPTYSYSTYLIFKGSELAAATLINDCGPYDGSGRFYTAIAQALGLDAEEPSDPSRLAPDLDGDGAPESLVASDIEMGRRLEVQKDGRTIWAEEGYFAHTGYNALFLCTLEGKDYLLRYHPYMAHGWCTYHYQLFTLSPKGEERIVKENQVEFDLNFQPALHQSFDIDAIAAFMDEINELLSHSVQLLNTDEDLLSTFEKEGQLADTLIWLDWWEPTYVPTHRNRWTLRAALEEFQQAMDRDRYNHTLEVQAVNEAGTDLRLSYKDRYAYFSGNWDYQFQGGAEPRVADLNQDGRDEIVVILYTPNHGTGVMVQELHVFDADTLEEYDCSSLTETLIGQVSSTGDQDNFYLTAPGAGLVTLPKAMTSHPADAIHLGDYVVYHFQDNTLTCRLGCDMGMLEYCGELRAKLTIDPATRKITASSFQYVSYYDTATGSLSGDQSRAYRQALLGEADLLLALGGEERTPVNIADVPALFDPDSGYARVGRFTVLDLDGAGVLEVVLRVDSVSGDMGGHVILHQENGQVLGLPMGHRSFSGLKTDGTFEYTDPTSVTSGGISSIRIKGGSYIIDDLAMWAAPAPGEEVDSYWVNHLEATEAQYRAVQAQQDIKPDAVWHDFTPENINTVFP